MEGATAQVTHMIFNVMSLLLVGGGLVLSSTFFVDVPLSGSAGALTGVEKEQPRTPVVAKGPEKRPLGEARPGKRLAAAKERPRALKVPRDKSLRITVPKMSRVRDSVIPYASGTDEEAFRNYTAVHLRGTGFPWNRQANVYIAGHRLGYVGTPSWLAFWDLNKVDAGDKIYVTDSLDRKYVYTVFKDFVVDPDDVYVTRPIRGKNVLTLQTCTLPDYSRRLIVQAERVDRAV